MATKKKETTQSKKVALKKAKEALQIADASSEDLVLEGMPPIKKATKANEELQKTLGDFLCAAVPELLNEFSELTTNKKWEYVIQLLPYATPKMQSSEVSASLGIEPLSAQLGKLATETIDEG